MHLGRVAAAPGHAVRDGNVVTIASSELRWPREPTPPHASARPRDSATGGREHGPNATVRWRGEQRDDIRTHPWGAHLSGEAIQDLGVVAHDHQHDTVGGDLDDVSLKRRPLMTACIAEE